MSEQAGSMRALRLDLFRRILAHARDQKTDLAPDMMRLDVSSYLDPERFALEQRRLFLETPQLACLSIDLPEPGSFRLFEDTGVPMVVVRGEDGRVRAFLNVCAHRGARVVREHGGNARRWSCRFHGWTYDTTGKVIGLPGEDYFCGKIDEDKQLTPCPVEERHGLVFAQATPGGEMDLDAHLGAFGEELDRVGFDRAEHVLEHTFHSTSNWKCAIDTYLESYHLPALHRDSFAHIFESNLFLLDTWGPHYRFTFPHRGIDQWIGKPESEWPIDALPITYFLFPNVIIAVGSVSATGSSFTTHRLFPRSVGEMVSHVRMYALNGVQSSEHRAEMEANFEKIKSAAEDEDYSVTGESWRSFAALPEGAKFLLGRHEVGVQGFHRSIERALKRGGTAEPESVRMRG